MNYWVYENWTADKKAVIHDGKCANCNDGRGCHPNPHGEKNGKWHGSFETIKDAEIAANGTGRIVRRHRRV